MSTDEKELTFWEHLTELLYRLRTIFYSLIVCTLIVMVFPVGFDLANFSSSNPWYPTIASLVIKRIEEDFLPPGVELIPISWFAPLEVYIYVSGILGVAMSSPVIAYELYKFINPALHDHERRAITPFLVAFTALFILGFFLGYVLIIPATIRLLLLSAEPFGLSLRYDFAQFFSLVAGSLFVCGFVMTFPIYLVLAVRAGILKTEQFRKNRKYIYGAILIAIAILDPDPSLVTETFLGIPLIIVVEVAIQVARRFEKSSE